MGSVYNKKKRLCTVVAITYVQILRFSQILVINPKYIINDPINNAFLILRYEIKSPCLFL